MIFGLAKDCMYAQSPKAPSHFASFQVQMLQVLSTPIAGSPKASVLVHRAQFVME